MALTDIDTSSLTGATPDSSAPISTPTAPTMAAPDVAASPAPATPIATPAQPVAPPAPTTPLTGGQPSIWKSLVAGALAGLAGSAGSTSFGGGLARGAEGVARQKQQDLENQQNAAKQASDIQFQSLQAAHMVAQTSVLNKQLSQMDEDHQQDVASRGIEQMKGLQGMGFTPYSITDDGDDEKGGSATQAMRDASKTGGVPPTLSVNIGPHKWAHYNLQQGAQNGTASKIINDFNQRFGQPAIQSSVAPKPGSQEEQSMITQAKTDWDLLHTPTNDPKQLQSMKNQLLVAQNMPDGAYNKQDTLDSLKKNIALSEPMVAKNPSVIAQNDAHQKDQSEINKNNAEASKARADAAADSDTGPAAKDAESEAEQMVDGNMDPSQASKRSSKGPGSYNHVLALANIYSQKKYGKPFDVAGASTAYKAANNPANVTFFTNTDSLLSQGGTLDQLQQSHAALGNGNIPAFNSVSNAEAYAQGNGPQAAYVAKVLGVADDYAKVMGGGQGSDTSRLQILNALSRSQSPQQMQASLAGIRGSVQSQRDARLRGNMYKDRIYPNPSKQAAAPAPTATGANGEKYVLQNGAWVKQ